MNYCESFCRTIQRLCNNGGGGSILPREYRQVEYLEATGTQYIITSVTASSQLETHCSGTFTRYLDDYAVLVGGRNGTTSQGRYCAFQFWDNNHRYLSFVYGDDGTQVYVTAINNPIEIIFNDASHAVYVNGVKRKTWSASSSAISTANPNPIHLFHGYGTLYAAGRLNRVTFYNNTTGEKLQDFIPCYRKTDSKPGMYDLVTNTFFTNAGTGEFTVGPRV